MYKIEKVLLCIIICVLIITVTMLVFKIENLSKEVYVPKETAIQLAQSITVLRPSFITAQDIDNYVKGTPLYGIGKYVIEAEKESGIGADYLLAIIIHESGWGRGPWAVEPWHNLFSWGITDSGPNSEAYKIRDKMTREQAIIYVANQLKALYLTKGGAYYRGETLGAIGYYYASDGSWAEGVISIHNEFVATLSEEVRAKEWVMETGILKGDLPSPQYFTSDYWSKQISKNDLAIILFRINKSK